MKVHILKALALAATLLLGSVFGVAAQSSDPIWFEEEVLNSGLERAPGRIDRATPRSMIESLFRMKRLEDWDSAAQLLNLNEIPPGLQAEQGPHLARQLEAIIDRTAVLDWSQLVDRPDGLNVNAPSDAATAGSPRRSIAIWDLSLDGIPATIRIDRIKAGDEDPVWVFSTHTVDRIVPLYAAYGPSEFEESLPTWARQDAAFGLMWWEFIGLPLLFAAAAVVGLALRRVVSALRTAVDDTLLSNIVKAAATPIMIAGITFVIWYGTNTIFVFSGWLDVVISPLVAVGFVTAALMLIVNTVEAALDRLVGFEDDVDLTSQEFAEQRVRATRLTAARRLLVIIVFIVGTGIVLSSANVFQSLGFSILASAGALTIVLGFAARRVLGNIMSSMQIALNQLARVGDRVVFRDHLCHVERINFTFVQLRDWDGTRLVVPVEEFVSETFENWTLKEPEMLRILKFKLSPKVDIESLREAFKRVVSELDQDELSEPDNAKVKVTGQDVFGIDVWFYVPCADPNTSWDVACDAREKLLAEMHDLAEKSGTDIFPDAAAAEAA